MKKLICLSLVLVLAATVLLSSCNDAPAEESSTDTSESSNFKDGKYVAEIPDNLDFGGRTFTFLTCGVNAEHDSEIVYTEDTGSENLSEKVNEAIKERNRLVEELLNIEIKENYILDPRRKNSEFANMVRTGVEAGFSDYQVVVPCIYDGATLAAGGYLYDLNNDIPHLNMSQPWWDQTFNEELTINNKLYFTVGDIGVINKSSTSALMFNKQLIEQYDLENPYDLVRENKWTMDKAFSMAKTISIDENQDGKITYVDSMGWSGQLDDMWSLFYASGEKIASTGSDGYPELTMYNQRSVNVIDKMLELVQDKNHYFSANDYFNEAQWPTTLTIKPFLEGRCLFFSAGVKATDDLRDMEDDFGVIPKPMYDETQGRYYSLINPWTSTCFAVPKSVDADDMEYVGIVLEALSAESKNLVHPAYYDIALKYQRTRDDDSTEMLDTIFTSRGCDLGIIYAWGGLDIALQELASQNPGTFTSTYQSKADKAENELEQTVNFYKNIE
jgi:ABC-type glycerol-3-phosphate transport system substrate-binding protein